MQLAIFDDDAIKNLPGDKDELLFIESSHFVRYQFTDLDWV
jgi:hypothetical protein